MNLPKNLKRLRKDRGLSQQRVADMNDIPRSTYAEYEQGKSDPKFCTVIKLSVFFRVTLDELIK